MGLAPPNQPFLLLVPASASGLGTVLRKHALDRDLPVTLLAVDCRICLAEQHWLANGGAPEQFRPTKPLRMTYTSCTSGRESLSAQNLTVEARSGRLYLSRAARRVWYSSMSISPRAMRSANIWAAPPVTGRIVESADGSRKVSAERFAERTAQTTAIPTAIAISRPTLSMPKSMASPQPSSMCPSPQSPMTLTSHRTGGLAACCLRDCLPNSWGSSDQR